MDVKGGEGLAHLAVRANSCGQRVGIFSREKALDAGCTSGLTCFQGKSPLKSAGKVWPSSRPSIQLVETARTRMALKLEIRTDIVVAIEVGVGLEKKGGHNRCELGVSNDARGVSYMRDGAG